jgi:hypothetical protein
MGALGRATEHDEDKHLSANDDRPSRIRVLPKEQLIQLPPGLEEQHRAERRLPEEKRAAYWRGIDWRDYDPAIKQFRSFRRGPDRRGQDRSAACANPPGEIDQRTTLRRRALESRDQRGTDSCAGFAVAAALRANIAIHRREDPGALNPFFIWGAARERDAQLRNPRGGLLSEALAVINSYGTPKEGQGPTAEDVLKTGLTRRIREFAVDFQGDNGPVRASQLKIQGYVDTSIWLGEMSAHLHAFGPVLANLTVERAVFNNLTRENATITYKPGQVFDGQLTTIYAGHAVVIVGYLPFDHPTHPDSFVVLNSYGTGWGDEGYAYLPVETAQLCVVASYGLQLREVVGYERGGVPCRADAQGHKPVHSHLFAARPADYVLAGISDPAR